MKPQQEVISINHYLDLMFKEEVRREFNRCDECEDYEVDEFDGRNRFTNLSESVNYYHNFRYYDYRDPFKRFAKPAKLRLTNFAMFYFGKSGKPEFNKYSCRDYVRHKFRSKSRSARINSFPAVSRFETDVRPGEEGRYGL